MSMCVYVRADSACIGVLVCVFIFVFGRICGGAHRAAGAEEVVPGLHGQQRQHGAGGREGRWVGGMEGGS